MSESSQPPQPEENPPVPAPDEFSGEALDAEGNPVSKRKLTPEEQLAAYEEALKNEDWGHQPC